MTTTPRGARRPEEHGQTHRRVTAVIPHYGDPGPTLRLIAQLRDQTMVPEIVVVDDASPLALPDVKGATVVRRDSNGGFGSAVNAGVAVAHGDLLLILNSDVDVAPDFVQLMVEAAEPWQPALVAPAVVTGGEVEHTARRFPAPRFQAIERIRVLMRWRHRPWWLRAIGQDLSAGPGVDLAVDWVAGVCMLVPVAVFNAVGGFDQRYFMYAEEVDLQRRLALAGVPRVHLGSISLEHVGGGSSDPRKAQAWLLQSRLAYADKWGGGGRLRALLTCVSLVNAGTDGARRLAGRDVHVGRDLAPELRAIWQRSQRAR